MASDGGESVKVTVHDAFSGRIVQASLPAGARVSDARSKMFDDDHGLLLLHDASSDAPPLELEEAALLSSISWEFVEVYFYSAIYSKRAEGQEDSAGKSPFASSVSGRNLESSMGRTALNLSSDSEMSGAGSSSAPLIVCLADKSRRLGKVEGQARQILAGAEAAELEIKEGLRQSLVQDRALDLLEAFGDARAAVEEEEPQQAVEKKKKEWWVDARERLCASRKVLDEIEAASKAVMASNTEARALAGSLGMCLPGVDAATAAAGGGGGGGGGDGGGRDRGALNASVEACRGVAGEIDAMLCIHGGGGGAVHGDEQGGSPLQIVQGKRFSHSLDTETKLRVILMTMQDKASGAEVGMGQMKALSDEVSRKCFEAAEKADGIASKGSGGGGDDGACAVDEKQLLEAVGDAISSCQEVDAMMNSLHDFEAEMAVRRGAFAVQRSEWRRLAAGLISTSLYTVMPFVSTSPSAKRLQGTGEAKIMAMLKELDERVQLTEGAVKAGLSGVVKLASAVRLRGDRDAEVQGAWRLISGAFEAWYRAEDDDQDRDRGVAHSNSNSNTKDLSWVEGAGGDVSLAESMLEKSRPDFGGAGRVPLGGNEEHSISAVARISEAASREAVARVLGCKCGGGSKVAGNCPALDASSNDFSCLSYSECGDGAGGGGVDAEELTAALAQVAELKEERRSAMTLMGFGDESSGSLVYAVRAAAARAGEQEGRVRRLEASLSQAKRQADAAASEVMRLKALVEESASSLAASDRAKDDVERLQLRLETALKESGEERGKRVEAEMMRDRFEGEVASLREAEERLRTDNCKAQQEVASLRESLSASMAQSQACSPAQQRVSDLMSLLSGLADSSNVAPSSEGEVARLTGALKRATSILSFLCGELDELEGKVAEAPLRERNAVKLASECLIIAGDAASLLGVPLEEKEGGRRGLEGVLDLLRERLGALREVACRREELRGGRSLDSSPMKTG